MHAKKDNNANAAAARQEHQVPLDKEAVNFDGYSTPDQTFRSKISNKRLMKSYQKSEH